MALDYRGYTKDDVETIKNELAAEVRKQIPEFELQDADIQNNLLDTILPGIMLYENLLAMLLNGYSIDYSSEDLFKKQAEELGLRPKNAFKSMVNLRFTGAPGDLIPKATRVGWISDLSQYFETEKSIILDSTGVGYVNAFGETERIMEPDTITGLISILADGIMVTNPSFSQAKVEAETFEQFKLRSQARLRSPRMGGKAYAETIMNGIQGVNPRLVAFYNKDYEVRTKKEVPGRPDEEGWLFDHVKGIEAVIGGGDTYEVAFGLYRSFFETQKLLSEPSGATDDDAKRTESVVLHLYYNDVPITFTRPKEILLSLKLFITFTGTFTSPAAIRGWTLDVVTEYVNNLRVGQNISVYGLIEILTPKLVEMGVVMSSVTDMTLKYAIGEVDPNDLQAIVWQDFNQQNLIPELFHDTYVTLQAWEVGFNL